VAYKASGQQGFFKVCCGRTVEVTVSKEEKRAAKDTVIMTHSEQPEMSLKPTTPCRCLPIAGMASPLCRVFPSGQIYGVFSEKQTKITARANISCCTDYGR